MFTYLLRSANSEPRRDQEQGGGVVSHSWTDCLAAVLAAPQKLLFGHCLCDFVPHSCWNSGVHRLPRTGGVPTTLTLLFWWWLSLFGLYASERWGKLLPGTRSPLFPVPNKPYGFCGRKQSSGALWKSRWPPWALHPNEPSGFCERKAILNHAHALVSACP